MPNFSSTHFHVSTTRRLVFCMPIGILIPHKISKNKSDPRSFWQSNFHMVGYCKFFKIRVAKIQNFVLTEKVKTVIQCFFCYPILNLADTLLQHPSPTSIKVHCSVICVGFLTCAEMYVKLMIADEKYSYSNDNSKIKIVVNKLGDLFHSS